MERLVAPAWCLAALAEVVDEDAGIVTIRLTDQAAARLVYRRNLAYDIKMVTADGSVILTKAVAHITSAVTRQTS